MESGTKVNIYKNITILYEDNHLIVCIKPEGILSQKDDTDEADMLTVLKEYLKVTYNKQGNVYLGLVHRLDRRVSGVMVFAKTSKAEGELVISGTKGYIYVPAPWWKTDYFEVRYENPANNKRHFYQLDGEGIRYEIVSFLKAIEKNKRNAFIRDDISKAITSIIQDFYAGHYTRIS